MFAEVAVNLASIQGTFTYRLPDELAAAVSPGHLVTVPFGSRRAQGVVVALVEGAERSELRVVEELVDRLPVLTPAQLELAGWLAQQTATPLIDCLTLMLPPGLSQRADSIYSLAAHAPEGGPATQRRLIQLLARRGPLRGRQIDRAMGRLAWRPLADRLVRSRVLDRQSVLDPARVSARTIRTARLSVPPELALAMLDQVGRSPTTRARRGIMLRMLIDERQPVEATWLYAESRGTLQDLRQLEALGLVSLSQSEIWRDPLEAVEFVPDRAPQLTGPQQAAWAAIQQEKDAPAPHRPVLLHGVTGSGKTEIYLQAVEATLARGQQAIVLTPEIALTPQTVRRFLARFPGQVGLVHSRLAPGERYDTWRRARLGALPIIIGPRSALFTPLPALGLIVVDESHDDSYKETLTAPRYHARETALAYARLAGAECILGTATPDVVTMYRADHGELLRLDLPERILGHRQRLARQASRLGVKSRYHPDEAQAVFIPLPPVQVVDMRQELRAGNTSLFSRRLKTALEKTFAAGEQAILFLNRRGDATHVFCRDCGWVAECPRCGTPLTHHPDQQTLLCHHCGYTRGAASKCPNCGGSRVRYFGAGTQSIEKEVAGLFPGVTSLRWDRDTTRAKGAHEIILAHFAAHRADVLIGTQMIAKGLDVPLVTLVGVVSADTGLNLPDFRAAERTFQILTQVAGRAGRGLLGGQAILQTYQPDHYAIRTAAAHDHRAFYEEELKRRRELGYPPFTRLVRLTTHDISANRAQSRAQALADQLLEQAAGGLRPADMIGPVPCFFNRIAGEYRWQIVLRAADPLSVLPEPLPEGWAIDIDPVSLL